jgi:hypothetical protein
MKKQIEIYKSIRKPKLPAPKVFKNKKKELDKKAGRTKVDK